MSLDGGPLGDENLALEDTDFDIVLIDAAGKHANNPGVIATEIPACPALRYWRKAYRPEKQVPVV